MRNEEKGKREKGKERKRKRLKVESEREESEGGGEGRNVYGNLLALLTISTQLVLNLEDSCSLKADSDGDLFASSTQSSIFFFILFRVDNDSDAIAKF